MILNNFLLIAIRYLTTSQKEATIRSMIKICFFSICIAICALTLVVCVMRGFEDATYQKMQTIYPDLIIDAHGDELNVDLLKKLLQAPSFQIQNSSAHRLGQALLYNKEYGSPTVIFIRGIDPKQEELVTNLAKKITLPLSHNSLPEIIHKNYIFIGKKLAQETNLSIHDKATLLYSNDEPSGLKMTFQQAPVIIGGIFKTGIDDFDNNLVFCSFSLFQQLFPDQPATQMYIKLNNLCYEQQSINLLKEKLNIDVYSWKDLYPTLISALKLEKWAMFFILSLIVLVASMNMISLTFMYITQKRKEIALLLCFGMPLYKIKLIFMAITLSIGFGATLFGLSLAYLIGVIMQVYPFISLPDEAYVTSYLPIKLDPVIFSVILVTSMLLSFIASIIAIKKIKFHSIAHILKYE
ncbi:ABC transporter permease [Candidatus Dependentiae bacterium]|nr:ABC transporter permease [Candidatus Dependentiae bacterium]